MEERELTFNDLETVGSYLLTPQADRMLLQRALAQAGRGELLPLARILYSALAQDPETLEPIPDDTWSDALYYAVDCADYAFGTGSAEERSDAYFAAGEAAGVSEMRLGTGYFIDYPCAYWPAHPPDGRPPYLGDTEFPILILGATWDPVHAVPERRAPGGEPGELLRHHPARRPARHRPPRGGVPGRLPQRLPAARARSRPRSTPSASSPVWTPMSPSRPPT